jgi:hypothetical protein
MPTPHAAALRAILESDEPSLRYKARVGVLREDGRSPAIKMLREEIRTSRRVQTLLGHRDAEGRVVSKHDVYDKWQGAHWVLARLAELGYPEQDIALLSARDQVLERWLGREFYEEFEATSKTDASKRVGVPFINGRPRRCASQQGYALYYLLELGLADERVHQLAERLLYWRWPDGGWNCDRKPTASHSTFIHTIHCMRALALYGRLYKETLALSAVDRAAEIFLSRQLFKRRSDGEVMNSEFTKLHYPVYWHYDILFALKVMSETGHLSDPRCGAAMDMLETKQLPNGGWPAEGRYYSVSQEAKLNADYVDWGGASKRKSNPWVTADALAVLVRAGRWSP